MPPQQSSLRYRPLRGAVQVYNPLAGRVGTLGFIANDDNNHSWLVSCYHVLGRVDLSSFSSGEPIYQPINNPEDLVARVLFEKSDPKLDCAAAKVEDGIAVTNEILGLRSISGLSEPRVGMRLLKSGCATGVTEGVITHISPTSIDIEPVPDFPPRYEICQEGDSGALWTSSTDGSAVALHRAGNAYGGQVAQATPIQAVLSKLNLKLITT